MLLNLRRQYGKRLVAVVLGIVACISGLSLPGCARLAIDSPSTPADFASGWTTVRVTRANGSHFRALLYYPAVTTGENAPIDPTGGPYPAVTFGHGWLAQPRWYDSTLDYLATHGYIVIASESETQLFPCHPKFAEDMRQCLTYLEQENSRQDSELFALVATDRFGVSGHSMGGGASILAAAADARIKTVVALAPAETWPDSAIAAAADVHVPICIIAGSEDTFTPIATNAQPMYDNSNPPKQLLVLVGGYHCGFIDPEVRIFCDSGSMDHQLQLDLSHQHMTEFFDRYLKDDQSAVTQILGGVANGDPQVLITADE
jgi:predicted dienelactone hydrolase